jgi:DNA-binding GntR family transcriptional regulator
MRDIVRLAGRTGHVYHRQLIDALKNGSKAECETRMEAHIERNIGVIRNSKLERA